MAEPPPPLEEHPPNKHTVFVNYEIGTIGHFPSLGAEGLRLQGHQVPEDKGKRWRGEVDTVWVMDREEAARLAAMLLTVGIPEHIRMPIMASLATQLPGVLDSMARHMTAGDN